MQHRRLGLWLFMLLLGVALLSWRMASSLQGSHHAPEVRVEETAKGIFGDFGAPVSGKSDPANKDTLLRHRQTVVNASVLSLTNMNEHNVPHTLTFNLFPDKVITAKLDRFDQESSGRWGWSATVEGQEDSLVTMIVQDGIMAATITLPKERFQIRHIADDVYTIREIDPSAIEDAHGCWSGVDSLESEVMTLTNQERQVNSLPGLACSHYLVDAARTHAQDMALNEYLSHIGKNKDNPGQRMTSAGYEWNLAGENIAAGYVSAQAIVDAWMTSPRHRENILKPDFCDIGVGYAQSSGSAHTIYWTQNFGRSRGVTRCTPQ